jgi:hypothetical protein
MNINQNKDITVYRGEAVAIDFKISQRSDYYVPFLVSNARVDNNPMVCITIGSTRRESKNIVTKQVWLELDSLEMFEQTTITDLGEVDVDLIEGDGLQASLADEFDSVIKEAYMYQFTIPSSSTRYFIYVDSDGDYHLDYHFTITLTLDEDITLDMTNLDYFYQIDLMDTVLMTDHLIEIFDNECNSALLDKLPADFTNDETGITLYKTECIKVINKAFPNHWGHRVVDPYTSPVASVSNIQIILPPRKFIVQSVVK